METRAPQPHIFSMIVYRPTQPKRRPAKAAKTPIAGAVIVSARPARYRLPRDVAADSEADARVTAFFKRMGLIWEPNRLKL
jgi:hypothetical protein